MRYIKAFQVRYFNCSVAQCVTCGEQQAAGSCAILTAQQALVKMVKRKYPWKDEYAVKYGLKIDGRHESSSVVEAAKCQFCMTYGRETNPGVVRKRAKTTSTQVFSKDKFNPSNIVKHMQKEHPKKWKEYIEVRDARRLNPRPFTEFFEQRKLEAFFFKQADVKGNLTYSIDKNIVEVIIRDMLFEQAAGSADDAVGDTPLPGDIAMRAFHEVKNEAGEVESYTVTIKNSAQFNHVVELASAGLSFRQISKVVRSDRENLRAAGKISSVSPGEASNMVRLACAIGLQALSEIMKKSWAFSIGADESSDEGSDSHLDTRIRFPSIPGFDFGPEIMNGFHLLAIPMYDLSHSGRQYADRMIKVLDALCEDWRMKLIGSSTDGAGNMSGHIGGFSSLLLRESLCKDGFYRVWCLAHQLDLVVKSAVTKLEDTGVFAFMSCLATLIAHLRRQKSLINEMGSKCPYYITTRWKSLIKVCKWLLANKSRIISHLEEKNRSIAPTPSWFVFSHLIRCSLICFFNLRSCL